MYAGERRRPRVSRLFLVTALAAVLVTGALVVVARESPREGSLARETAGVHPALNCTGVGWLTTHLWVNLSACQAGFLVVYAQNFSNWNSSESYNYSFWIDWIAEFTPAGQLVRVASPLNPFAAKANVSVAGTDINLTARYEMNVTNATGSWTPDDTWAGSGPQWNVSNASVGTALLTVEFHLKNAPVNASANATYNASLAVKFDVGIEGWPWASAGDLLGFDLSSLGAGGSHFSFDSTNHTMLEQWNKTNQTFASLVFGTQANATYPSSTTARSTVGEQVGLFYAASPARESITLVTFGGIAGNYSYVSYDPWVVFSPGGGIIVPPSIGASGPSGTPPWLLLAAGVAAAVAGMSLLAAVVVRSASLRRKGMELVRDVREAISVEPTLPGQPK